MFFTLPFIVVTLGIGIWMINALLFMLTAHLVKGFFVESFGAALWGALVVSLTSLVVNILIGTPKQSNKNRKYPHNRGPRKDDIIDI